MATGKFTITHSISVAPHCSRARMNGTEGWPLELSSQSLAAGPPRGAHDLPVVLSRGGGSQGWGQTSDAYSNSRCQGGTGWGQFPFNPSLLILSPLYFGLSFLSLFPLCCLSIAVPPSYSVPHPQSVSLSVCLSPFSMKSYYLNSFCLPCGP